MVLHLPLLVLQSLFSKLKFGSIYTKRYMENFNACGIYKITNTINNHYYIGSSHDIKTRIRKHFELLKRNCHHSIHFQNAYNKYGRDIFTFEILEICNKDNILIIEQQYLNKIDNWKNVYNISRITSGNDYDISTHPNQKEIRLKISNGNRGKHTKPFYINNVRYEKLQDAANEFNVDIRAISSKLKNWKNKNWYYENKPKIGEYNFQKHNIYFYKPTIKKKYFCNCGTEITKDNEFCNMCRKLKRINKINLNPVIINCLEYDNPKIASKKLNIKYATLIYRINSKTITYKDYYYKNLPKDITMLLSIDDINKKISDKNKGNLGSNHKPFKINTTIYLSLSNASKILNIPKTTIRRRLLSNKYNNYQYT
jgi:group I intron endonuclease